MTRQRRRGTTRYIGDLVDEMLDRVSDVEHDLRRTARTAVEERDSDRRRYGRRGGDEDYDDRGYRDYRDYRDDEYDDELEDIIDALTGLRRRLHRSGIGPRRRRGWTRVRRDGDDDLTDQLADLSQAVEALARQVEALNTEDEPASKKGESRTR